MWRTRLTSMFPCSVPIVGAPMAGVSGGLMAVEVCRAGGLGFIGAGHCNTSESKRYIEEQIEIFNTHQTGDDNAMYPLCLGFISCFTFREDRGLKNFQDILRKHNPKVVLFFAPAVIPFDQKITNISLARECCGCKVLAQVGTVNEASEAVNAGVDGLVIQGTGAGGHGVRREYGSGTLSLALDVMSKFPSTPVIAAGGICDGRGTAAMLLSGCDGVMLGTRLWASQEALGKQTKKEALVRATSCDQVIRTTVFDTIQNTYSADPWPEPFDSVGAIKNKTTDQWEGRLLELKRVLDSETTHLASEFQSSDSQGDPSKAVVLAGEGVGLIDSIENVYDIITRINLEAKSILQTKPKQLFD